MLSISLQKFLMVKFYVVDGISYPACETSIGIFGGHGYEAMKACRDVGFADASAKKSMNMAAFQRWLTTMKSEPSNDGNGVRAVNPVDYYLQNRGFSVAADENEITMARLYCVEGLSYPRAEEKVGIRGRKGFEAMYSVCKLGAFHGAADRGSMTLADFEKRLRLLGLASR